jgi:crotonobetainyl-CoA:carnitine CoA-transferase CaiB-like acyl-CoA transferase
MPDTALGDIKVLDLTHHIAGPYCTKLLADFGAEVIKVEPPGRGDPARHVGPFYQDEPHPDKSGLFLHLNTNKLGITLNLKTPEGVRIFKGLLEDADVVVENFAPRVMPSLGLTYKYLAKVNPGVVMTSISNFGQTGPYRDFVATELTLYAMECHMAQTGLLDREPIYLGGAISQYLAGNTAALATMAGIMGARLQGEGQQIDISIVESWLGTGAGIASLTKYSYSGLVEKRASATGRIFPAKDGFVHFVAAGAGAGPPPQREWGRLVKLLDRPELLDDERFATFGARSENVGELLELIRPWLTERTKFEITRLSQAERVFAAPLLTVDEVVNDPHNVARGFFEEVDHPATGPLRYPGAPAKMTETPRQTARAAPMLGQHNEEMYSGRLGYSKVDLARLREAGII